MRVRHLGFLGIAAVSAAVGAVLLVSCEEGGGKGASAKTRFDPSDERHQSSYAVGLDMGQAIRRMDTEFDLDVLIMALRDGVDSAQYQFSDSALAEINARLRRELNEKRRQKSQQLVDASLAAANEFLEKNKANPGVVTTESGLQYTVITEGTGKRPTQNDMVKLHYLGTLPDGTGFDSTMGKEPVTMAVTGAIAGWAEALQLMKVGSKYKIFVPPDLAFGRRGARAWNIGPNMVVVYVIELLGIESGGPAAAKAGKAGKGGEPPAGGAGDGKTGQQ